MPESERYVVVSSDGHAGAELHAYRDYLERAHLDEFDAWAKTFVNPWDDLRAETAYRNRDSATRLRELEDDGVAAEVLFANTIPPFLPLEQFVAAPARQGGLCAAVGRVTRAQSLARGFLPGRAGPAWP